MKICVQTVIQYQCYDDLPFTGSWKDHHDALVMEINTRESNEQIKDLQAFSHLIFYNCKIGHSGMPGESLQGSFSLMIDWPSAYMHWESPVCFLDCHCASLHFSQKKEGPWKAHLSSLTGLVLLILLLDWNSSI